ncbi:hypothetical protein M0R36_05480 [bacterium]|jgi:hypothetical protein|nr:hypothetical protein [bacterium]
MSILRFVRQATQKVFFIYVFFTVCLPVSFSEDGGIQDEIAFLEKVALGSGPHVIDGIDYNDLSIQDAIKRLYETDREIAIQKFIIKQAELEIKKTKVSAFFPTITAVAGISAPVDLFYEISNARGAYLGQRLNIAYKFDSDLLDRINAVERNRETELTALISTFKDRFITLMETYLNLSLSQKELVVCVESYKEAKSQLEKMRKDPKYTRLDILKAEYNITPFFKEALAACKRYKDVQRDIKIILGFDGYETLIIKVSDFPETLEEARNMVLDEHLRQPECSIDVLKKQYELAKAETKLDYRPLLELIAASTGTMEQDTIKDTPATYRATSSLVLNLFVTDFGYSDSCKKFSRVNADIAEANVRVENDAIERDNFERNSKIREFSTAFEAITEFIAGTEEIVALMKERIELPIEELLKKNEQLLTARLLLRQLLRDYTYNYMMISRENPEETLSSPPFQNMTFEDILDLAESNKTPEELAMEKNVELQMINLKMARCFNNPVLKGGVAVENESYATGEKTNTTKAFISVEGKFFDIGQQYMIEEAKANLEAAKDRLQIYRNRKYIELINNFVKIIQYKRQTEFIQKIMGLKESVIDDMSEDKSGEYPKYEAINIKPLVLEQLEANINLAGAECNLFICEYNLKKLAGIPLSEKISLQEELLFDGESGTEKFLDTIRKKILPFYDSGAGISAALNTVNAFKAAEIKQTAFRGFSCQFLTEFRGEDLRGFRNPDMITAFICSVPFGGNDIRNIEKSGQEKNRFDAELEYAEALKELDEMRTTVGIRSREDKLSLRRMKLDRLNLEAQHRLTEKLVELGTKQKREQMESEMRLVALDIQMDTALQDYIYNESLNGFLSEMDENIFQDRGTFIISGLPNALALAMETSDELKSLKNKLGSEEDIMNYINSFYFSGSVKTNYVEEKIKGEAGKETKIESFVFIGTIDAEVNFISSLMKKEQEMKVEMGKLEVERAKFDIAQDVIGAYTDYLKSMAVLSAVNERYYKEKETLDSIEEQMKSGIKTRMEYLKQEQVISLIQAKLLDSKETADSNKKHLEIAVGSLDPRFSVMNLEIFDKDRNVIIPTDPEMIRLKLDREIDAVRESLVGPLIITESKYGEFSEEASKYATRAAAKRIRSLLISVNYSYLTNSLSEIGDFEEEVLDLPLLTEESVQEFKEFVNASASLVLYDPGTGLSGKIESVEEKITALKAQDDIIERVQGAQMLLDTYDTALRDFNYAVKNLSGIEHEMENRFDDIRRTGKMDLTEELKVLGMLLQMKIERIESFYGIVAASNRIDQYLRKYVNKGLDEILQTAEPKKNEDIAFAE